MGLVRELLREVSTLLGDVDPQFTHHTERELAGFLNDAQRAIAKYVPSAAARIDAVRLTPGARQFIGAIPAANIQPGDGVALTAVMRGNAVQDVHRNMGADGLTPGRAIRAVTREVLDAQSPLWSTVTGTAVREFVHDPRNPSYFYVSPAVPAAPQVWVELNYLADPVDIPVPASGTLYGMDGSNTTITTIPARFEDDIVNYIVARSFLKDSDSAANLAAGQMYAQMFVSSINAQAAAQTGVNPNLKLLPFAPAAPVAAQ